MVSIPAPGRSPTFATPNRNRRSLKQESQIAAAGVGSDSGPRTPSRVVAARGDAMTSDSSGAEGLWRSSSAATTLRSPASSCQKSHSRNRIGETASPRLRAFRVARRRKIGPTQRWLSLRKSSRITGRSTAEATIESYKCHHNCGPFAKKSSADDETTAKKNTIKSWPSGKRSNTGSPEHRSKGNVAYEWDTGAAKISQLAI